MTMTQPAMPQVLNFRGWFQSVCRTLEPPPPDSRPDLQRPASEPEPPRACDVLPSVTAPWSPVGPPSTVPVGATAAAAAPLDPQDWDLLFQAVLEMALRVARQPTSANGAALQPQAPDDVWAECLAALDQLRRSVPVQQQRLT